MARKPDIQYIEHFFTPGSAAPSVAPKPESKPGRTFLPQKKAEEKLRILVDPVALAGLVVAAAMLILMVVGVCQFQAACQEQEAMSEYLTTLKDTNLTLEHDYRMSYDLAVIEEQALALGMVPIDQVTTISVTVTVPEPQPEPTFWDELIWFFQGMFA